MMTNFNNNSENNEIKEFKKFEQLLLPDHNIYEGISKLLKQDKIIRIMGDKFINGNGLRAPYNTANMNAEGTIHPQINEIENNAGIKFPEGLDIILNKFGFFNFSINPPISQLTINQQSNSSNSLEVNKNKIAFNLYSLYSIIFHLYYYRHFLL